MSVRAALPWLVLAVAFFTPRVYVALRVWKPPNTPVEMERSAKCLADRGFLGDPYPGHGGPSAHVAPLYPAVLAGVYAVFGDGPAGHAVQSALAIAAVGLGVALLPAVARVLCGRPLPGWVAAFGMCVLPFAIVYLQVGGEWEQPWSLGGVSVLVLRMRAVQRAGWRRRTAAGFGLLVGALTLLNPQFGLVAVLFVLAELIRRVDRRTVLRGAVVAGLVAAGVVAPWTVRNAVVLGGFCPVRSNAGLELAVGNNDHANGRSYLLWMTGRDHPVRRMHPFGSRAEVEKLHAAGELAYMAAKRRDGVEWITANPARFAVLTATRLRLFWFPTADMWPDVANEQSAGWRATLYSVLSALMFVGLVRLFVRDRAAFAVAAAVLLGLSGAYYVTHVDVRYLFPLHGLSLVLAADVVLAAIRRVGGARG